MLAAAARFSDRDEAICFGGNQQRIYAHARNFRKDINGVIIPIDLVVTTLPRGITQVLPEPLNQWAAEE